MENIKDIFIDQIEITNDNMRQYIDRDAIFELAADIKQNGLINPITVRPLSSHLPHEICVDQLEDSPSWLCPHTRYEVVAGQRRLLAHQFGGILKIKCIVRELTDQEALAIMTAENLARVDVSLLDEARHIGRLMTAYQNDIKMVSKIVGYGEKWVKDRMTILVMPEYLQNFLQTGKIKLGVALILNQITDGAIREMWSGIAARDGVSVAQAQFWFWEWEKSKLPGGIYSDTPPDGFKKSEPVIIKFRCAIDGKEYDVRTCKSVIIYEGNVGIFNAFVEAYNTDSSDSAPPSEKKQ